MDKYIDALKTFLGLTPTKKYMTLLIAVTIAALYFAWTAYQKNEGIQAKYDKITSDRLIDSKDCNKRIDTLNARWEKRYDSYRGEREKELKKLADDNQQKIEALTERLLQITKANIK
jgi:hypothetical protein